MKITRPKFSDLRLKAGPNEGWCFLFGGRSAHYFRAERSLCRKYMIAPTTRVFQVPVALIHQTCPGCLRSLNVSPEGTANTPEPKSALSKTTRSRRAVRRQKARPGELRVTYTRFEGKPDVVYSWGEGCSKRDGALMDWYFSRTAEHIERLERELESRGYDLSTLVFSVMKKKPTAHEPTVMLQSTVKAEEAVKL